MKQNYLDINGSNCKKCKDFHFMAPANSPDSKSFVCYACRGGLAPEEFYGEKIVKASSDPNTFNDVAVSNQELNDFDAAYITIWGGAYNTPPAKYWARHRVIQFVSNYIGKPGYLKLKSCLRQHFKMLGIYDYFLAEGGWEV